MIRQLFRAVAIVCLTIMVFVAAPTPANAAGFFERTAQPSNQKAQEDQYTQQKQYKQKDQYDQEDQAAAKQDSQPQYSSKQQSVQSREL